MPRTITDTVYTASELRAAHPRGFENALYAHSLRFEFLDELAPALRALCDAAGVALRDWQVDAYGESFLRVADSDALDLSGRRAFAWFENRVLDGLRIGYAAGDRWRLAKYGERAGCVRCCPLTGTYWDHVLLDAMRQCIRDGGAVRDAFNAAADAAAATIRAETEEWGTPEYFIEYSDANGYAYYASGELA